MRRALPVPEALAGERVDVAVARLTGLSRAQAAELAAAGRIGLGGQVAAKSSRLTLDALLEIELPDPPAGGGAAGEPEPVAELPVVYQDADLVVVNKPVGVAAHGGPGWHGPTVIGSLLAAGIRPARGGPPERRGIVQRLDVGTSGVMMVAKSEQAYSILKQMFRDRAVKKIYHAVAQGLP
ncbi:MAG: RluA family pseudouridine synthase, partial [Bifidobacteriaceae bacterium]|nr:RluA family pseudouridine synthase [Bifidobacteriaceae bacterium]